MRALSTAALALALSPANAFVVAPAAAAAGTRLFMSTTASPEAAMAAGEKLSEDAKQQLAYLRSHRKIYWDTQGWGAQAAMLMKKVDTAGIYVSDVELETNAHLLPGKDAASGIAKNADAIAEKAWAALVSKYPMFADESDVSKMLKTDMKGYLRVVSYGVAAANVEFLRDEHIAAQVDLYAMCNLDLPVVKYGVEQLKAAAKPFMGSGPGSDGACFDALAKRFS